ncbi:GNAT family N-acetyltransferase [Pectobacterium wasabiae]|uniref:GNAT family acetyltransferase n=1 Tax=Pectobacterium wasabiae TaxID=55208 RepID=A0AAW3EJX5_9GAMM|nr:GNAT family N-acetyltransferase [Pectobacterium wasabiae]AOR64660.1 GNAT family acetyltransferase [Pectobacterium wasabiae CFBP 3304]EJS93423.1 Acetyltransferase, GNAT family [Pectobacterium wasabiae CFBP 3304]KFX08846.1 GNAT family acetyltransferase [Pectobacterium wasabiae]KGA28953.1 GNAT family acetyltransferase [Pectobacterium wasabiae]
MLKLIEYDRSFLDLSWIWLNDPEIKKMTMTPSFTKEQQDEFFNTLKQRDDYIIYGVVYGDEKIGVAGIKNIHNTEAEYWGYIGEKKFWGMKLGEVIIDKMLEVANVKSIERLTLKVVESNKRAIALYHKKGFVVYDYKCGIFYMERRVLAL